MKRVLVLSDSASVQDLNNRSNLNLLLEMDCEIHVGCNFVFGNTTSADRVEAFINELKDAGIKCLHINFSAGENSFVKQERASDELEKLLDKYEYDLIHCLGLSCLKCIGDAARQHHIPVICTTYGLPIYKGVSILKRALLLPKLKKTAKYAETLICCNCEDYEFSKNNFSTRCVFRIPGIGLDPYRFRAPTVSRIEMRDFMEIPQNAVTLVSVGALTKKKNHAVILKAISRLRMLEIHYVICGGGDNTDALYRLTSKLNIEDRVHFTKHRDDIVNMLHACDIFCMPSKDEGIGIAALEAMEAGLPLITSNVHGINDFMEDGVTGFCFKPNDVAGFVSGIEALTEDKKLRKQIGEHNRHAVEVFYRGNAEYVMKQIYKVQLADDNSKKKKHGKKKENDDKNDNVNKSKSKKENNKETETVTV